MARGRKRKTGKREPNGRLSRAKVDPFDKGTERVQAMRSLYGANSSDPIGRAYERGLLGSDAKTMLDTARAIARVYWAWYAVGPVRCAIADRTGANIANDEERERRQEEWLNGMLRLADRRGFVARSLFDQLVINVNPDEGPAWLDRILARTAGENDFARLASALDTLADCAGVERPSWKKREAA